MILPKKLKTKWLAALRSGKYKQGKGAMYKPAAKTFCCLGVLNHICLNGNVEINVKTHASPMNENLFKDYPSPEFCNAFDIDINHNSYHNSYCSVDSDFYTLSRMNDEHSISLLSDFNKIADWIEKNVESK